MRLIPLLIPAVLTLAPLSAGAAQSAPSIVSTEWLGQHLRDRNVVVLHMAHDTVDYRAAHISGAREIRYPWITTAREGIGTELPTPDSLKAVFERLGVSDASHVIIYASGSGMAPMASRTFLSLDYLGHQRVSLLSGGLARWQAEGRPVNTDAPAVAPGTLTVKTRNVTVDADWVNAHTGKKGYAFIDTRTTPEYLGTGDRGGLRSEGHLDGARQLEWQQLFANADSAVFLDTAALGKLFADRSAKGDTLITYCLVGYRASMTYFAARTLGLPVKIYDGSYQDWARRALPVKKGETP